MMDGSLLQWPWVRLKTEHPYARDFFAARGLPAMSGRQTVSAFLAELEPGRWEDLGMDPDQLTEQFLSFIHQMEGLQKRRTDRINHLTIVGGKNKDGRSEKIQLTLRAGEVIAVVGPTGSGKSMLLSDIECLAQGDTPSGRRILIDNQTPDETGPFSGEHRLVAQLSQNMNFVMDLSVREFLSLHAESRLAADIEGIVEQVFNTAEALTGEPFSMDTPVTALSGGQSRALMIADVACLSASPVVLIDEIENAGVDRRKALNLLVKKEKIVLMATHDPLLALNCSRRIVIRNGGMAAILDTTAEEKELLGKLDRIDARFALLRNRIRNGDRLEADLE